MPYVKCKYKFKHDMFSGADYLSDSADLHIIRGIHRNSIWATLKRR